MRVWILPLLIILLSGCSNAAGGIMDLNDREKCSDYLEAEKQQRFKNDPVQNRTSEFLGLFYSAKLKVCMSKWILTYSSGTSEYWYFDISNNQLEHIVLGIYPTKEIQDAAVSRYETSQVFQHESD